MSDQSPAEPTPGTAYELLTKPTADLTPEQVKAICIDLRRRRETYIKFGNRKGADRPDKAPKRTGPVTAEEKASNTEDIMAALGLDLDE